MESIRNMLSKEQERLRKIHQTASARLQAAPEGTLRLSTSGKWTQYYHYFPGEGKNGVYIPRKEEQLVQKLAQKSYDEKIVKLTEKRLSQIGKILKDYDDEEIQAIYNNEHKERQCFIQPVDTWLMRAIEQEATLQNL